MKQDKIFSLEHDTKTVVGNINTVVNIQRLVEHSNNKASLMFCFLLGAVRNINDYKFKLEAAGSQKLCTITTKYSIYRVCDAPVRPTEAWLTCSQGGDESQGTHALAHELTHARSKKKKKIV